MTQVRTESAVSLPHNPFPNRNIALSSPGLVGDVVADFAAAVEHLPHRPAVVHNGTSITYRELAERVGRTSSRYRARGCGADGPSRLIGVLVSHTPAAVEHLLGILQAGGTYCPIDVNLPAARKETLAEVLGLDRLYAAAPGPCGPTHLPIETLDGDAVAAHTDLRQSVWRPSDPAYVLCTSGSTGTPKPVVISRHGLTVTVRALRELFALTAHDRVLQFASLGWDTCLEEIMPALTAGAALIFDEEAQSGSLPRFVRMLARREVSVLDLPTAFWHELVLFLDEGHAALPDCLRLMVIGGERVDPTRLRQWRDLDLGHVTLLNTYGCTETTMITHAVQLSGPGTEPEIAADAEAPIGRPLAHVRDRITVEGELLVSGPNLAIRYLGLPDATATEFPVEDYGAGPAARWFRTGDMVVRGERGLLYSSGRADEEVKVLGVRLHPAEVEAQLNSHPAVAGAVVLGERILERTALTAYVALAGQATSSELKDYLRERLPCQFVPSKVKFVPALAYTSNGKIDRAETRCAATD